MKDIHASIFLHVNIYANVCQFLYPLIESGNGENRKQLVAFANIFLSRIKSSIVKKFIRGNGIAVS